MEKQELHQISQFEESLINATGLLNALINVMPVSISIFDSEKRFTYWNKTAEKMFGWSVDEVLGNFNPTVPADQTDLYDTIVENHTIEGHEVTRQRKDGSLIELSMWGATLRNEQEEPIGTMVIAFDMSEQKRMERLLFEAQKRMDDILLSIDLFVWSFDLATEKLSFCSGGLEDFCGITPGEMIEDIQTVIDVIHSDDLPVFKKAWDQIKSDDTFVIEYRVRDRNGEWRWLQSHGKPWRDENGGICRVDAVSIDITDRKLSEMQAQERQQRYESLLNLIPDAVVVHREGVVRYANEAAQCMLGLSESPVGRYIWEFFPEGSRQSIVERYSNSEDYINNAIPLVKHRLLRADGTEFPVETSSVPIADDGELSMLTVTKDISGQVQTENELRMMANHDPLTGLPNRRFFWEQLDHLIEKSTTDQTDDHHAVLFIDMDRFKLINDTFGHGFGDHALMEMTERLRECLPDNAVLSRFGGDEFAILCAYVTCEERVALFAERIISQFIRAIMVGEREFYITPSIGVAMYPYAGTVSETLLKHADGAMYVAKANGGNRTEFYRQADQNMIAERLDLETDLKKALERNEISIQYQPKFRLDTGEIYGIEALLRWNHPERGVISPAQFIPIAEECGVIVQLGQWVLREACRQNREWQEKGYKPLVMCVNVSPKQFQICNMVEVIANVLTETHMDAVWLGIEITEGLLVHNSMEIASVLKKIRTMGVLVAIDDFGTGYSSLAYLQKFEPTHLKIDQSFVSVMFSDAGSKSIVNAVIDLAHNLGMQVVAEGVESEEQLLYLKEHGCDMAQGFLYSKPINCAEFERNFLRQTRLSH